jgi:hypothetical protein
MTPPDGVPPDALRELVREVLRDVLPALATPAPAHLAPPPAPAHLAPPPGPAHLAPPPVLPAAPPSGIPAMSGAAAPAALPATQVTPAAHATASRGVAAIGATSANGTGPQPVRLATDEDLHAFVLRVIALADNPKRRRDLLAGRLRFTLAPARAVAPRPADTTPAGHVPAGRSAATATSVGAAATVTSAGRVAATDYPADGMAAPADHRIEKGAVTERAVQAAASAGARLVLGPRAVLTPLARDRARALGVPIEKER